MFSPDGKWFCTNEGRFEVASILNSTGSLTRPKERVTGEGVFLRGDWVMDGGKELIHLPDEYKATHSAIHGNRVAMSHLSGLVTVIGLDATEGKTL